MSEPKKKKSTKKIVSNIIFSIVMAFLCLFTLIAILQKTINFSIGGCRMIWVLSPSMKPTIEERSYILVKDCKAEDVNVGDIIMFISDDPEILGKYNTHRVLQKKDNGEFVTKGDNNLSQDKYTAKPDKIIGKYDRTLPFFTFIGRFYSTPAGFAVSAVLIVGLFGVWFAIDLRDRRKEEKEKYIEKLVKKEVQKLEEESKKGGTNEKENE